MTRATELMTRPAASRPATVPGANRGKTGRLLRATLDLPFVLPVTALTALFVLLPTGTAIYYSFTDWSPGYDSPWIGLRNYTQLFQSTIFHEVLGNQFFLLLGLPVWIALPLILAYVLHERVAGASIFRTIFFFPATASPALLGLLLAFTLSPDGPLNGTLSKLGLGSLRREWLSDPSLVKPVLIGVLTWSSIGTGIIIFSAGLSAIPSELFEVAELDGAGWWQRLRFIVVPGLRSLIEMWAVILVITVFVGMFPWVYTLTRGGPGYSSRTMDFDIYTNSLSNSLYGSAAAEMVVLLVLVGLILMIGSRGLQGRRGAK